ncbi:E3 ubiquitin protein ligase DRIP2 [Selaginella moellendorffii]|uniref:E3 ubiquitin protein ligase DRIP2 n=1 Tax=Selaginella moellendorffii TaxID=88036 RepID=UPI000D1C24A3|nr:E3 ubiquitin protein ligase DRIP2 [Selaginella moellendorffii]XP_024535309.1 E3 ubiquitin protein ligase DRIP2 [Selaginella moellendorffii]|eukprot:XP_024535308.1 E3 ubiquitin protein ligase DRIP2 [Selaginella moellendorffii]
MEVVKVARAPLVACLTCPLCSSLLDEATTICECLHSFCRECIHLKLSEDDTQSCPICDVYLGVAPLEKLRPDPQLDELRNKLFSPGAPRVRVPGDASPLPRLKRKERSLSSLGVFSAPSSSRRRKPSRPQQQHYTRVKREITSSSEEDEEHKSESSDSGNHAKKPTREDKGKSVAAGYHSPLAYLAELADSDHAGGSSRQQNQPSTSVGRDIKRQATTGRFSKLSRPTKGVPRRRGGTSANNGGELYKATLPPRFQVVTADNGVWFALKPAANQSDDSVLPAITTPYVRITDGRLPVSLVKKYIATKLNLGNETDVELNCRGQPIVSSLPVENVQRIWLAKPRDDQTPSKLDTSLELLMTLTYKRPGGNPTNATAAAT